MNDERREEVRLIIEQSAAKFLEVEKLREENEQLRAELEEQQSEMLWIYGLRDATKYAMNCYVAEIKECNRLRAELARIKPSWDDAPEWATALQVESAWNGVAVILGKQHIEEDIIYSEYINRPKDDK